MGKVLKEVEKRIGIFLILYAIFCFVSTISGLLGDVDNMFALIIMLSSFASPFIFMFGIFLYLSGSDDKRGNSSKTSTHYSEGNADIIKYKAKTDDPIRLNEEIKAADNESRIKSIKEAHELLNRYKNNSEFNYYYQGLLSEYDLNDNELNEIINKLEPRINSGELYSFKITENLVNYCKRKQEENFINSLKLPDGSVHPLDLTKNAESVCSAKRIKKNLKLKNKNYDKLEWDYTPLEELEPFSKEEMNLVFQHLYKKVLSVNCLRYDGDAYEAIYNILSNDIYPDYFKDLLKYNNLNEEEGNIIIDILKKRVEIHYLKRYCVKQKPIQQNMYNNSLNYKVSRKRNVSLSTRTKVLERDNYTCRMCGRNVEDDGVKLEVDHIYPVSKVEVMI